MRPHEEHEEGMENPDDLQQRIDASLRRLFTPPAGLQGPEDMGDMGDMGGIAARAVAGARRRAQTSGGSPSGGGIPRTGVAGGSGFLGGFAAAAAVLAGFGLWTSGEGDVARDDPPREFVVTLPEARPGPLAGDSSGAGTGSLALASTTPDLDALYERFAQGSDPREGGTPSEVLSCTVEPSFELERTSLQERLTENYDACLDVDTPDACALLGPYAVPEWPSATVVVAWCATESSPTMLVVDDQTGVGCGWAPRQGERPAFHKAVGSLALWEVGGGEPHLLDGIRACAEVR